MPPHSEDQPVAPILAKRWHQLDINELYEILRLRTTVFFLEQRIDEEELDGRDREPETLHVWIEDAGRVAAYLRVIRNPQPEHRDAHRVLGRVVVAPESRGHGLARRLLLWVMEKYGDEPLLLHSQSYVVGLYADFGFEAFGDEYLEAGIPHRSMYRPAR